MPPFGVHCPLARVLLYAAASMPPLSKEETVEHAEY
jgi:hypothetical protein